MPHDSAGDVAVGKDVWRERGRCRRAHPVGIVSVERTGEAPSTRTRGCRRLRRLVAWLWHDVSQPVASAAPDGNRGIGWQRGRRELIGWLVG